MGDATKEKWDTEKMREHRNDWSLAADIHLFTYMQQFSQNLLSETHTTLKALDSLESDIGTTCVEVSNIGNRFWALSDTQFVENRVYDDDDVTSPVNPTSSQVQVEDSEAVVIQRLQEAIQNGLQVLDSKFETVQVPASDSDEDDSSPHSGVILKPINRYKDRRLPHLIGSAEFRADDTLGLRDALSDEETDDFMSASDKANESESMGESEDSDIESDQTKTQPSLPQAQNNIFADPQNLRLPGLDNIQPNFAASSPPSGDLFAPQGDNLFSDKKPVFSSWQPTDLWATEEDDYKGIGDDSGNNRPPSANSSISSAQSSNVSEPIKKTSEDFGKSGTGRQAVLVQEDQDDLFGSKPPSVAQAPTKEFVPAGGVKIFAGEFNPFRNPPRESDVVPPGTNFNQGADPSQESDSLFAPVKNQNRPEKNDAEEDNFAKKQHTPSKVLPKDPPSNVFNKKKGVSLFDEDEEDDLFSNKTSEPKPRSQPASLNTSRTSFGTNKSEPEDDDLFSNSSVFSESRTNLSHSIFKDDLFDDESEDLFASIDSKKQKSVKTTSTPRGLGDSLFSDQKPLEKDQEPRSKPTTQNTKPKILGEDLFGDGEDLFGEVRSVIRPPASSSVSKVEDKPRALNSSKKDLFDEIDNDNDDLFGSSSKSSKANLNSTVNQDILFGNKTSNSSISVRQEVQDDLFRPTKVSTDFKNPSVKAKPSVLKPKKGLEKRSLFDSDSDDDLFSSPQGSLSSRKSIQSATAPSEFSDREEKNNLRKDSTTSRLPKTDFSSIFSNDQDETVGVKLDKKTDKMSSLFGEDEDLFSTSNSNVKTPELFNKLSEVIKKEPVQDSHRVSEEKGSDLKIKSKQEDIKSEPTSEKVDKSMPDPVEKVLSFTAPLKKDIFDDSPPEIEEKLPITKKIEPPKSLDIKPITETLKEKQPEAKVKESDQPQKPAVSKKPSPKVLVETPSPKDTTDGEVISPPSPTKAVPGKLKASQLISINTAALLPGARPSKSEPMLSSSAGAKAEPQLIAPSPSAQSLPSEDSSDLPPKSSLLQSVNKERVKIQSKRRPSSRRARQQALRSASLDTAIEGRGETDDDSAVAPAVPPGASTLMSPSTDEEDLFGVPPLDVVYDVKTVSPSTDIFGTPTVLSPVTNKEIPSSFVSTPFVHSQPPPLDEEQEDGSNQEDDLFGSQSNLISSLAKEKKPPEIKTEPSKKEIKVEDIFSDVEDDGLFQGMKEAPPPLVDDDDDEEYDELFMTRKKKENFPSKVPSSGSVIAALESLPREDPLLSRPAHSSASASSYSTTFAPKGQDLEDDFIFPSQSSLRPNPNSLFSSSEKPVENDDSLFSKPSKHSTVVTEDNLFPSDIPIKKPSESSLGISSHKDVREDSLFSHSVLSDEKDSSLFAKPTKASSDLFSTPDEISSKVMTAEKPAATFKDNDGAGSDDELFGSQAKSSKPKLSDSKAQVSADSNPPIKKENEKPAKSKALFGEDEEEEVGNLFSSATEKKMKAKPSVKSSLFGDEDDDDIFSSLSSSRKPEAKTSPSVPETSKGSSSKSVKSGSSASLKPVKLETKQTFSDPLFSHEDKE